MQWSGDGRDDTESDAHLRDIQFRGDASVETTKDYEARAEDQIRGRLTQQSVGEDHGEGQDQSSGNLKYIRRCEIREAMGK